MCSAWGVKRAHALEQQRLLVVLITHPVFSISVFASLGNNSPVVRHLTAVTAACVELLEPCMHPDCLLHLLDGSKLVCL